MRQTDDGAAKAAGTASAKRARWTLDRTALLACALGAATVAGFAPLYLFPLPIFTLGFCSTCRPSTDARSAARLGWWFGLGFFLTGVSWVYVSLHDFGAMPAPLAALATLLFCAYLALFPGLVGYAFRRLPGSSLETPTTGRRTSKRCRRRSPVDGHRCAACSWTGRNSSISHSPSYTTSPRTPLSSATSSLPEPTARQCS